MSAAWRTPQRLLIAFLPLCAGVLSAVGCTGSAGPTGMTGPRWSSLKEFIFGHERSDIGYSESRMPAEVATYISQRYSNACEPNRRRDRLDTYCSRAV